MKTSIYYFTGTGNSLFAAKYISNALENSQLTPMAKALNEEKLDSDSDVVGIVFPLYCGGLPEIVIRFAEKLKVKEGAYVFAIATRGGSSGHAMIQLEKILKEKNSRLNSNYYLTMPANYIRLYNVKSEDKVRDIIEKANIRLGEIVMSIKARDNKKAKRSIVGYLMKAPYKGFLGTVHNHDSKYYWDGKCNKCGICEKVCPVNNIKLTNGKPEWKHNCQDCMACIHLCPQQAIQIGEKTINRGRYKNPHININEIIEQK